MRNHGEFSEFGVADVVVIGGGVIGLSVARALARRGVGKVALVERSRLGTEASSAAGGMLAPQAEADGPDKFFELARASRDLYQEFAEELLDETGIDIELESTGTLYLAFTSEDEKEIEERHCWQARAGLSVERLTSDDAQRLEPNISPNVRGALRFPNDVQVENRRLIAALATSAQAFGVRILEETNVGSILTERDRVVGVETSRGAISAPIVVVACGAWTSLLGLADKAGPQISIEPVRGQMLCFETNPRLVHHVVYSPRGYLVPRVDGRLLAGSTSEHAGFDKRVTAGGLKEITAHALEISPRLAGAPLVDSWAGLRPRSDDDWPVIGACTEKRGLYYATGHYRNGILLAPLTGELLADEIMTGAVPPMLESFRPERFLKVRV